MKKDKNILLKMALSIISIFLVIYYWKHITWGMGKFINLEGVSLEEVKKQENKPEQLSLF